MTKPDRAPHARRAGVLAPAAVLALTGSLLVPVSGAGAEPPAPLDLGHAPESGVESETVTLITGDVVHWQVGPDGQGTALVEDTGEDELFETIASGDDFYVIPSDVAPLVGEQLDRELFNIAGLVEQGYTDDLVEGTPVVIAKDAHGAQRRVASTPPGLSVERSLPSINGVAGTITRSEAGTFGEQLSAAASVAADQGASARTTNSADAFGGSSLAGVEKIWLDRKVEVSLEDSVPQTGAPQAWAAGFDGTGSTIAILDTGIDLDHPDVAGQVVASQDFSGQGTIADGHGHGTHVAATAAGSGAASDGLRAGVAPGADLVIGKVMDDNGDGMTSHIIEGMEWAASQDEVDVINMSLGGGPTDGSDPMSLAVNELTEQHDVLFVVSAGNEGPGDSTLSYPASAEAALAVGAVDKDSELARFSSRGPRLGDFGIKPEITAPGVGIQAARASGTSMGSPIDDDYTSANGTSMASPHVAGAVAIVRQQHPDWDAETVKAALVNSATPHAALTSYEQGGGELNLARAIGTTVVTSPSVLSLGYFEFPHTDTTEVTETLTYTNHGDSAARFDLEVTLTDDTGTAAPEGMVTAEPSTLELGPGASAEVVVTLDRSLGGLGVFSGSLAMVADGQRMAGTPIGFMKDREQYDLTIEGVQRDGRPAGGKSTVAVLDAVNMGDFGRSSLEYVDGVASVRVPPGTYSVTSNLYTTAEGTSDVESQTMMGDPEVSVTQDTHLVFDAREAREITVDTPYDDVTLVGHSIQYHRRSAETGAFTQAWGGGDWPYFVAPTEPVTLGEFSFGSKFELSAPGVVMNLAYPELGAIPADPSYVVNDETTATVEVSYHSDLPDQEYSRAGVARFPWEPAAFTNYRDFQAPLKQVEIYSANETRYQQAVLADPPFGPRLTELERTYTAGTHEVETWFASPNTPSVREGNAQTPGDLPTRTDNTLDLSIFEWGDANPGEDVHYGYRTSSIDETAFRLYQDGEYYAYGERAFGTVPVDPQSRLRLELDVARGEEWWTTSTQTRTAWEFDSATTSEPQALPLLQVDYDINLDLRNQAKHPKDIEGPFTIGLDVRQPYGGADDATIEEVRAWLSYDGGQTWDERTVESTTSGTFEFKADNRDGGGGVSIKVEARDADGNTIEQEITNAYKLRP